VTVKILHDTIGVSGEWVWWVAAVCANGGSISGSVMSYFSTPLRQDRLWGVSSLLHDG
jgi:hypothetical protein